MTDPHVVIHSEPRQPESSPKVGVDTDLSAGEGDPVHRFVTIGDSITQGFMSGAIFKTDLSWPALVAYELGVRPNSQPALPPGNVAEFKFPVYEAPNGPGGLPIDIERAVRGLEQKVGSTLSWFEIVGAARWLRKYMDGIEDYWEDAKLKPPKTTKPYHNLAVYGADLLDVMYLTVEKVTAKIGKPSDAFLGQGVEHDNELAWKWVLDSCRDKGGKGTSVVAAAQALGDDGLLGGGKGPGIETLVVMLGANNALGSVVSLDPKWTTDAYGKKTLADRMASKGDFNLWQPAHFVEEWNALVTQLKKIKARHVIVSTVPAVTIAPIARGVKGKVHQGSRDFTYYTRPWVADVDFDLGDPHITAVDARTIDSAIDAYNEAIIASVKQARLDGLDWYLFDLGGLLDRLAARRYEQDPSARPVWWSPYPLPPEVSALAPVPDSRFFQSGPQGRTAGGLFSLDGVHPTTISAGVIAHEVVQIMRAANVEFFTSTGTARTDPVGVDFTRVLKADSLISRPPTNISSSLHLLGWLDDTIDWIKRALPFH